MLVVLFHHSPNPSLHSLSSAYLTPLLHSLSHVHVRTVGGIRRRTGKSRRFVALSTHSNAKILKPNRKSRFGQTLSVYDSEDDEDFDDDDDEEEEEEEEEDDDRVKDGDDWLNDDYEFAEIAEHNYGRRHKKKKREGLLVKKDSQSKLQNGWGGSSASGSRRGLHNAEHHLDAKDGKRDRARDASAPSKYRNEVGSYNASGQRKLGEAKLRKDKFPRLCEEIDLDERWLPLLDYLTTFGLKESHFLQMYVRHASSLQTNVYYAQERLEYLCSIGVKQRDVKRILLRQPQILGYTVESNLKSHVAFLMGLGIPNSKIGQIIAAAPSLFSYSVENSLKPTVRYLVEEVGIKEKDLGKVVQLSPQILVQRIDISWNTRYLFLSEELGASRESVVKMVKKHPQLLHYSIDDGLLPRINFLRSIGMRDSDILKVLTSLTQVLSLSLEDNLKPKYLYLVNELRNEVHALTKYPTYLSLSLDQRIRPRHKFLVALKRAPKGPFPLSTFVPNDESFCQHWAGTSVDKYLAFRQSLLLKDFAKKYEK